MPWVPGVFLFKGIGAGEINLSSFPSTQSAIGPASQGRIFSSIKWSSEEDGDEEDAEWI